MARCRSLPLYQSTHDTRSKINDLTAFNPSSSSFLLYTTELLNGDHQGSGLGLISPTSPIQHNTLRDINLDRNTHKRNLVDSSRAMVTKSSSPSKRCATSFQIQRGGSRVATVFLTRSSFRLGETVSIIVDFQGAGVPCFTIYVSLETSETVDPGIALRSSTSIQRATRRIHGQVSENTVCAQRSTFAFMIPITTTPGFITSGVSLEWSLRLEFVTGRDINQHVDPKYLFENILEDDRGNIVLGSQDLPCEIFDVKVPLEVHSMNEESVGYTHT